MRVLTEEKRAEIVAAAGRMFALHGYSATSMAMIAAEAGASKATLYRYFTDKVQIFADYVVAQGAGHRDLLGQDFPLTGDCAESLNALGRFYLSIILSPGVIEVNRLVVAEAVRFPELLEIYFANGPSQVIELVERTLRAAADRGWLHLDDPADAAWTFKSLCERKLLERAMWGFNDTIDEAVIQANLAPATAMFLTVHGVGPRRKSQRLR
jgi:TetR/AcrR family transcriptional repressor of mexJK operon